ncbi:MAG: hypothetical protein H6953_02980 [Chromatiaceae bacterium]|nr:hypothetical protein [Chromatiaceae bacterium]MCP5314115.1 hypothetical protein [Chromatiaceae bacterium]
MEERTPAAIAEEWIEKWSAEEPPAIGPGVSESTLDWEIPRENPTLCLEAIEEVLARIDAKPGNRYFQVLAAGPLEDVLNEHGKVVVDQVAEMARQNPEFRLLLNGVWPSEIDPSVLEKLQKFRGEPW